MKMTLKLQLIERFITVIWIITIVCSIMGTLLINRATMGQAEESVIASLKFAREVLNNRLGEYREFLLFRFFEKHHPDRPFSERPSPPGKIPRGHKRKGQIRYSQHHR